LLTGLALLAGCDEIDSDSDAPGPDEPRPVEMSGPPPEIDGDQSHDGPHGGHVIELGRNHKFHAELVEDHESRTVRVFVLDGEMQELPIQATTLVLNLTTGDKTTTFDLASANPGGLSAEFLTTEAALMDALHAEGAVAKLRVAIQGATYVGTLDHGHDCECEHEH
jgi:hypothetical protein